MTSVITLLLLALAAPVGAEPPAAKSFVAHLDGGQEVPERETAATRQFVAHLDESGTALTYKTTLKFGATSPRPRSAFASSGAGFQSPSPSAAATAPA